MTVVAWVGPDEFDGSRGLKQGMTPGGMTVLAAKGEHEAKLRQPALREQMQMMADAFQVRIQLVRFNYIEVIETIEPGKG